MNTKITPKSDVPEMTEDELKRELRKSLLILTTSSPDKRKIYKALFTGLDNVNNTAGIQAFITDSGALGIPPAKTPEMTGSYKGNGDEKARQQLTVLKKHEKRIRERLRAGENQFNSDSINIVGMTEDSGWEIIFTDEEQRKAFIKAVKKRAEPQLRPQDLWLLGKLDETRFPGPNLKPLQEHLNKGFHSLMEIVYEAAKEVSMDTLRYRAHVNISFVSPRLDKRFSKTFEAEGELITEKEYIQKLWQTGKGESINADFIQIPDGQGNDAQGKPKRETLSVLRSTLLTASSKDFPARYIRRDAAEWLQELIAKRRSTRIERKRPVRVAYASPETLETGALPDVSAPVIRDFLTVDIPTRRKMRYDAQEKCFGEADAVVLIPAGFHANGQSDGGIASNPNLRLVLNVMVTAETDPESMRVPVILDNRTGRFDPVLDLIRDAFLDGRLMGEFPLIVVDNDDELRNELARVKSVTQLVAEAGKTSQPARKTKAATQPLAKVPSDGIFTVFIGGGHANNSRHDLENAQAFGYYCASQNWRIITGAGSIEGSMGATHTGFIQYHLDQLRRTVTSTLPDDLAERLNDFWNGKTYDAEAMIQQAPDLVDALADRKLIPRGMFYGYNMESLLQMESHNGKEPPGITYCEAGNRVRRLDALLASGTKIFLRGGIGTDEEFEETVRQHIELRLNKRAGRASNGLAFTDGTPDDDGAMIIYNCDSHLDKLLQMYHLFGDTREAEATRREHNITVVTSLEELKDATQARANTWLERVRQSYPSAENDSHKPQGGRVAMPNQQLPQPSQPFSRQ